MNSIFFLTGGLGCLSLFWFCLSSLREKKPRAALIGGAVGVLFALAWFGGYFIFRPAETALLVPLLAIVLFTLLFFSPLGKRGTLRITGASARFDERDVMFAREDYQPGTEKYERYYAMRPENRKIDDTIRRLGAVTTDLPLVPDQQVAFGVQGFCAKCKKCVANCPSKSIPASGKTEVRGVEKWQLDMETCLRYWRVVGTDCGLCMKVCPFSHPPTFLHNLVRIGIRRSSLARQISLWADDLFYGRKVKI